LPQRTLGEWAVDTDPKGGRERDRHRYREADRETDRDRERQREEREKRERRERDVLLIGRSAYLVMRSV